MSSHLPKFTVLVTEFIEFDANLLDCVLAGMHFVNQSKSRSLKLIHVKWDIVVPKFRNKRTNFGQIFKLWSVWFFLGRLLPTDDTEQSSSSTPSLIQTGYGELTIE